SDRCISLRRSSTESSRARWIRPQLSPRNSGSVSATSAGRDLGFSSSFLAGDTTHSILTLLKNGQEGRAETLGFLRTHPLHKLKFVQRAWPPPGNLAQGGMGARQGLT